MSSNQQILSIVGQALGSYFGPVGAAIGGGIGSYLGASLDTLPDAFGPRLEDRKLLTSSFGTAIPFAYGSNRISGNIIWLLGDALTETSDTDETGGKSGQPAQSTTIYTYTATFALLLSQTPSRSVRRIWAGAMLLYDGGLIDSVLPNFGLTFYRGSEDQLPDPLMEAEKGVGLTPAYRGYSYLVFDAMPVEKTGWPCNFTVELVSDGEFDITEEELGVEQEEQWFASTQRLDGNIIGAQQLGGVLRLSVLDQQTGAIVLSVDHDLTADGGIEDSHVCYVPPLNEVWIAGTDDNVLRFDATSLAYLGDFFNGAMFGGTSCMVWDPVRQRVFHRPNAQWVRAGGQNVVLAGAGLSGTDIINAERCGYIGLDYVVGFEAMDAIVGNVPGHALPTCAAAYDPMRRRYVVFNSDDDECFTVTDSTSPVITAVTTGYTDGINLGVTYDASTDCILKLAALVGYVQIAAIDAETLEVKAAYDEVTDPDRLRLGVVDFYPDTTTTGRVFVLGNYQPWAFTYFGTTVGACVRDLSERSNLQAADVDVSQLDQTLRGYLVSQVGPARPAIQQLAQVYSFVGVEEDDLLRFKMRGADPVAVIERVECGATEDGSQAASITKVRAQQLDLPSQYSVTAPDPGRDYQAGTQFSQRQAASAGQVGKFQTAAVLDADEQLRLANLLMYDSWAARNQISFATDKRFTRVMPGDVVLLDGERALITTRDTSAGVIKWEGISDDASVLTQYGIGVVGSFPDQVPPISVPTYAVFLDVPLLSDADDTPGAYAAAWGIAPHWRGGILYRSLDLGVSWRAMATFPRPGVSIGTAVDVLGDFSGGNVFDEFTSLTVRMRNGTPFSATRDAVLAGGNGAAVRSGDGWEILQYRNVTTNADGSYTLTGFLRGRLGSEWAMAGHAVGDEVVLLSTSTLRDFAIEASEIGVPTLTKAVSIGSTLSDTDSEEVTIAAERLKPLSPVDFRVAREVGTDDATLTWRRRSRLSYRFLAEGIVPPLGEDSEAYEVDILDGVTIVRTITVATNEAAYSAADQTADGLTPGDPITARVYAMSETVGRGHLLEATA
jgi:hypothetical protein